MDLMSKFIEVLEKLVSKYNLALPAIPAVAPDTMVIPTGPKSILDSLNLCLIRSYTTKQVAKLGISRAKVTRVPLNTQW